MCESRRKLYTQRACAVATNGIAAILFCAILLIGNLPAFNLSPILEAINCTKMNFVAGVAINCRNSSADGVIQLEAIEKTLSDESNNYLEKLTIENSRITRCPPQICNLTNLREIRLNDNNISELPNDCFRRIPDLEILEVQRNCLRFLQDGLFDGLKKLKQLSFRINNIASIGLRVFSKRSDLPRLQSIDLNNNNLTVLEPWPFIRAQVVDGVAINLTANRISRFTNELNWSFKCGMKPFGIVLDLGGNEIRHLTDLSNAFNLTKTTDILCLAGKTGHPPFEIKFRRNPIICDCTDLKLIAVAKKYPYIGLLNDVHCHEPFHLQHQMIMTVMSDLEKFVCEIEDLCPVNGRCLLVPANRTLIVSLSNTNLSSLPLQLPPLKTDRYRYQLDFSRNSLSVLSGRAYLVKDTYSLDVSHSSVETVTDEAWKDFSGIEKIRLHGNRLTALPRLIQSVNYSFQSLSLYGNPLSCTCRDSWMKDWLRDHQGHLEGTDSILCQSPPWLAGRVMFSVEDYEHCTDPNTAREAAIGTSTAIGILVVLGLLLFLAVHRRRNNLFAASNV